MNTIVILKNIEVNRFRIFDELNQLAQKFRFVEVRYGHNVQNIVERIGGDNTASAMNAGGNPRVIRTFHLAKKHVGLNVIKFNIVAEVIEDLDHGPRVSSPSDDSLHFRAHLCRRLNLTEMEAVS